MQEFNQFIAEKFYYLFLGILIAYLVIRLKKRHSLQKRRALFTLGIGVFLTYTLAILPIQGILPHGAVPVFIAFIAMGEVYFLRRQWVFRRNCVRCGRKLDWSTTLMDDRNTCSDCLSGEEREASQAEEGND